MHSAVVIIHCILSSTVVSDNVFVNRYSFLICFKLKHNPAHVGCRLVAHFMWSINDDIMPGHFHEYVTLEMSSKDEVNQV